MHTKEQIDLLLAPERALQQEVQAAIDAFKLLIQAKQALEKNDVVIVECVGDIFTTGFKLRTAIEDYLLVRLNKLEEDSSSWDESLLSGISVADLVSLWAGVGQGGGRFVLISDGSDYEVLDRLTGQATRFDLAFRRQAAAMVRELNSKRQP